MRLELWRNWKVDFKKFVPNFASFSWDWKFNKNKINFLFLKIYKNNFL